jgi:hypothetical protein
MEYSFELTSWSGEIRIKNGKDTVCTVVREEGHAGFYFDEKRICDKDGIYNYFLQNHLAMDVGILPNYSEEYVLSRDSGKITYVPGNVNLRQMMKNLSERILAP